MKFGVTKEERNSKAMEKRVILVAEGTEEEDFVSNHCEPRHPPHPPLPQRRLRQHCPCLHSR